MAIEEIVEKVVTLGSLLDVLDSYGVRRAHEVSYPCTLSKYCA